VAALYPSLIAADQLNLEREMRLLEPHCQGFHLDVMDNHFVPNLTWGPLMVNALARATTSRIWVHLMVDDPLALLSVLELPAESLVSFHIESTKKIEAIIDSIKEKKWHPSLAISPKTDPTRTFPFLHSIHQIVVMSVEPGFSGQEFIPTSFERIDLFARKRATENMTFTIGVDGGVNATNIDRLVNVGCDDIVLGAALFKSHDPVAALRTLQAHIAGT